MRKKERLYTVRFKGINPETGKKATLQETRKNLREARVLAGEKYREGSFVSLKNNKGVALPI